MIPRIEQKLEVNKNHYLDLLKWIKHNGGKVLYPERIICSRYFDNKNDSGNNNKSTTRKPDYNMYM